MNLSDFNKHLPTGSSAFAQVLSEIHATPDLTVTKATDEADGGEQTQHHDNHHHHGHHKEGQVVHGLHHCYKIEGGHCHAHYGCHHNHAPVGDSLGSPSISRRRSVSNVGGLPPAPSALLNIPDASGFRSRSNSDAASRRRHSMLPSSTSSSLARSSSGNLDDTQGEGPDPVLRAAMKKRRGSNVVLHSGELHFVYDQLKGK